MTNGVNGRTVPHPSPGTLRNWREPPPSQEGPFSNRVSTLVEICSEKVVATQRADKFPREVRIGLAAFRNHETERQSWRIFAETV
jgi:hypothetical protein